MGGPNLADDAAGPNMNAFCEEMGWKIDNEEVLVGGGWAECLLCHEKIAKHHRAVQRQKDAEAMGSVDATQLHTTQKLIDVLEGLIDNVSLIKTRLEETVPPPGIDFDFRAHATMHRVLTLISTLPTLTEDYNELWAQYIADESVVLEDAQRDALAFQAQAHLLQQKASLLSKWFAQNLGCDTSRLTNEPLAISSTHTVPGRH